MKALLFAVVIHVTKIISRDNCSACVALHDYCVGSKAKFEYTQSTTRITDLYPTVYYDNGTTDNGELIYFGQAALWPVTEFQKYIPPSRRGKKK